MITVTTTDPAEAEAMRSHMQSLPGGHDYQVYYLGRMVGERKMAGLREELGQRLHPARKRMRQLLIDRGRVGYAPGALWHQLCSEGFDVARETVSRWLDLDQAAGFVTRYRRAAGAVVWIAAGTEQERNKND